ncbi:MAG: bifunctional precorrin-2 dehydrogenase/sirohydrochlorin ferrochelatase, partial [Alphaproteobacteria bacterium]
MLVLKISSFALASRLANLAASRFRYATCDMGVTPMRHFPLFLNLDGRRVVIAGGSEAAAAKWRLVARSGARIAVVAPSLEGDFAALIAGHPNSQHIARALLPDDLADAALVYVATGERETDAQVAAAARAAGVPVNVVDRTELCDFITPAIVDRAPITV